MISFKNFKELKEYGRLQKPSEKVAILIGLATCGIAAGAKDTLDEFEKEVKRLGLEDTVDIVKSGCVGSCYAEPTVEVRIPDSDPVLYGYVGREEAQEILLSHIGGGEIVSKLKIGRDFIDYTKEEYSGQKQVKIATRNCGAIDPERLEDYILNGGYLGLGTSLFEMSESEVIEEIKKSGLRGRGGGGFPTGMKWEYGKNSKGSQKYMVCNADEGDPGAFMDRSILEGDPHSVLEAMAIGGYAIGADKGYIYIRAEYPLAIERLKNAIEQGKAANLLGDNILGSGFSFHIELRYGAGAFVCGEETALISSIEGNRGEPRNKPPFPAESGLWGCPTIVNNVETYANIPSILVHGADWFSKIGSDDSKGTKVFALAGKVRNVGLVEVPMGTTIREVVYDIAGGIVDDKPLKAIQTGGPSGGCIPGDYMDTGIDYGNLCSLGSMMGSGGMIVMDSDDCMVNIAKFYLEFSVEESCGKCTPCRVGNKRMYEILDRITKGESNIEELEKLKKLGNVIKDSSLCGLGQSSPNPILSTINYFEDEYRAHIEKKRCPSKVCESLISYGILEDRCVGCTMCARVCPVGCIDGEAKKIHKIDRDRCIKCGACLKACKFDAVEIN